MSKPSMTYLTSTFPTPSFPYYGARLTVSGVQEDLTIERIEVNGDRMRDYYVFNDGEHNRKGILRSWSESIVLCVRTEWTPAMRCNISVVFKNEAGETENIACVFTAPKEGGYWNRDYGYYASVILTNSTGYDRVNEPVHQPLAVYADRISDPKREVRVVEVDSDTGVHTEIPSQIGNVHVWDAFADQHCQPTCNFDAAFMSNVPAFSQKVYLVFYGNKKAEKPKYETDLKLTGEGLSLTVSNAFYSVKLHELSGSIDEVTVKQGVNETFAHHLETNGSMNWNPDIYAPPTPWNHISDWNPPENYTVEAGPVFVMLKRWGNMPMYPDVLCSVTYTFYASYKPVIIADTMELTKDLDVIALRNGEVVINRELAEEIAWENSDGSVESVDIGELPRHPVMGKRLPENTPWVALFNRERQAALGVVYINFTNIRKDKGLERVSPHLYVHVGPWIYVAHPILYTFVGNNPQRVMHAFGNTLHYEKLAWIPFRIKADEPGAFDMMDEYVSSLKEPIQTEVVLDTDPRVPDEWIPPILLEEFNEL